MFGVPDVQLGEAVVAVVRLGGADTRTSRRLRRVRGERLAYFKVPSRIVEWDDELPKRPRGRCSSASSATRSCAAPASRHERRSPAGRCR